MAMRCVRAAVALALGMSIVTAAAASGAASRKKKVRPSSTPIPGAKLKTNEWVAVEKHGADRRGFGAVVYLPGEKSWVLMMGYQGDWNDGPPFPYDEQTFNLKDRLWRNRFPPGKPWKPEVGPSNAPRPGGWNRPGVSGGRIPLRWCGHFMAKAYSQYALDTHRNVVVAFARHSTLEYDTAKRVWRDLKPKGDPQSGKWLSLRWGSLCYDALNKEFVLFGGEKGGSRFNDTRTWIYSPANNQWRRLDSKNALLDDLRSKTAALRTEGEKLYGACMARYFKTELPGDAKVSLGGLAKALGAKVDALARELAGKSSGHEKTQCGWAAADLKRAGSLLARIRDVPDPDLLKAGLAAKRALWRAEHTLLTEPPARAHSQMVYDPVTKTIVLFGGDRLDMLYADTWTYDCSARKWREQRPEISPSPRAGHAFLYMSKSRKLALVGGYGFYSSTNYQGSMYRNLPMQAWTYDVAGNKWRFVKQWPLPGNPRSKKKVPGASPRYMGKVTNFTLAADDDDVLLFAGGTTYACKLDLSGAQLPPAANGKVESTRAVKPGTVERRTGPYDPNWYLGGTPPTEATFQAKFKAVPANAWTMVTDKQTLLPRQNRDYGTAAFAPDRDAILWWGGGHSCHCGTDLPVFSMRTGRYCQLYAPGFPLENIGKSGGESADVNFMGQPWIPAHTYHSYAYDPVSRKLICCNGSQYYAFDPANGNWTQGKLPFGSNVKTLTVCSTPQGPYAWNSKGLLFRYDGKKNAWSEVKTRGEKLTGTTCMVSGMCYDSKRNRLIMAHKNFKGDLVAVDLKTLTASRLAPRGMARAAETGHFLHREMVYDASRDVVVVATGWKQKAKAPLTWPVYDCARNAWIGVKIGGKNVCGNSLGLTYDPMRKLVVAVDANGRIYVLKLDMTKGKVLE